MEINYSTNEVNSSQEKSQIDDKTVGIQKKTKPVTIILTVILTIILLKAAFVFLVIFYGDSVDVEDEYSSTPKNEHTLYTAPDYNFVVTADEYWTEDQDKGNYELKLYNEEEVLYFFVMPFKKMDLVEDLTCEDIQKLQVDELLKNFDKSEEIESSSMILDNRNKIIYESIYSTEVDHEKDMIYSFGVDLKDSDEMLWVLVLGLPSEMEDNRKDIEKMVMDIR